MCLADDDARALAAAALADPYGAGRDRLVETLLPVLSEHAQSSLDRDPRLRSQASPDDLVHEFLLQKVLPAGKFVCLLEPVAQGRKALVPRLKLSLVNFLHDQRRRQTARPAANTARAALLDYVPAPAASTDEQRRTAWQQVEARVADQLGTLRQTFPPGPGNVRHGPVLRLSLRVQLAQLVAQAGLVADRQTRSVVEQLTPWTAREEAEQVSPGVIPLGQAWQRLCEWTGNQAQDADAGMVAAVLGIGRALWLQWLCRARKELSRRLGLERARELFPHVLKVPGEGKPA